MPKIKKGELDALNQLFVFDTQYCISNPLCKTESNNNKEKQINSSSLCSLGVFDGLVHLLLRFPMMVLWIKYDHLVHSTSPMHIMNHERSFFCESVLPGLLGFSKISNFIELKW